MTLSGYIRPDESVGFRNHVAILSSVGCANDAALKLGRMYPNVLVLTHRQGCAQLGADKDQSARALAGLGDSFIIAGEITTIEKKSPRASRRGCKNT
jgi:altronate dehydratase large subunit